MIDPIDRNTALGITEECAKSLKWILSDEDLSESERKECEWKLSFVESIISDLKNVPSIAQRPEPCDDAVLRKAVEEMLQNGFPARGMWEIEGDIVKQTVCETLADALMDLEKLPSVTPEPCEDAVSRKSILEKISKKDNWEKHDRYNIGLSDARQIVQDEPSVTPKRKE